MTDLPPDCAALFRTVLDSPRLRLPKLVLADYLDEHGEPVLAHGFRWCAAHGRHPDISPDDPAPGWRALGRGKRMARAGPERLPWAVAMQFALTPAGYSELRSWHGSRKWYAPTPWLAFAAVADALETLAAVVRLPRD